MKDILYIIALSLGSIVALFFLTKLMGHRQLSEMSMFDYVNGITIGSIAAEMSTSLEENFTEPLIAMVVYALVTTLLSLASLHWVPVRRFLTGKPLILFKNNEIYRSNLKKAKIDLNDLLAQSRIKGYFDISKLDCIIMEDNGKISFLPKSKERPLTPGDINLSPNPEYMVANLIFDGKLLTKNLKNAGKDYDWLMLQMKKYNVKSIDDVLLATCDFQSKVTFYMKKNEKLPSDILV